MGGSSAPAPDPRMAQASLDQIALNTRIYDEGAGDRAQYRALAQEAVGIQRRNSDAALEQGKYQMAQARQHDDRYWNTAVPFEDALLKDVNRYDSADYKNEQVRGAVADTQAAFDRTGAQTARGLQRMGVNPSSGRYADMSAQMDIGKASALASAASKTRMAADQIGLSTKMNMYGGMRGLAGLGNANAGLGLNAYGQSGNSANGMVSAGGAPFGVNNAAQSAMNGGVSAGVSGMGQYTQLQQRASEIDSANDPFKAVLSAGLGYFGKSDRRLKTNIRRVGATDEGVSVYTYQYVSGGPYIMGVMADEADRVYPDAVHHKALDGEYSLVDYSKIGGAR